MLKILLGSILIGLGSHSFGEVIHNTTPPSGHFQSLSSMKSSPEAPSAVLADNSTGVIQDAEEQVSQSLDVLQKDQEESAHPPESKVGEQSEEKTTSASSTTSSSKASQEASNPAEEQATEKATQNEEAAAQSPRASTYSSPEPSVDMERSKPIYSSKKPGTPAIGSWMINLGTGKPNYSEINGYKDFYGKYSNTMDFGVDWFFLKSSWGALGLTGRFSYYADRGSRLKSGSSTAKAPGSASFTAVSKVIGFTGVASPLPWHWVVFKGWLGRQYDSFEETRDSDTQSTVSSSNSSTGSDTLLQKGKRQGFVKGAAVLFNLSFLDGQTVNSLKPTMGLSSFYLAPFRESFEQKSVTGINLSRSLTGVMLVFGSAY